MPWVVLPPLQVVLALLGPLSTGVEDTGRLDLRGTGDIVVQDCTGLGNPLQGTGW